MMSDSKNNIFDDIVNKLNLIKSIPNNNIKNKFELYFNKNEFKNNLNENFGFKNNKNNNYNIIDHTYTTLSILASLSLSLLSYLCLSFLVPYLSYLIFCLSFWCLSFAYLIANLS